VETKAPAEAALTRSERRLALAQCLLKVGWSVGFGLTGAARI
jgi:hypothetical protein